MEAASTQDRLYRQAGNAFAPAIARLARSVERDREKARDLEQEIHAALWQSLARFDQQCALKTWVYRVAHNVAADHVQAQLRRPKQVQLDEIEALPQPDDLELVATANLAFARVQALIRRLPPLDAQVILLWLEGQTGNEIAEITGLNVNAAQVRVHRIKSLLAASFQNPETEGQSR